MDNNSLCTVVVTYHPDDDVLKNLATLRQQVEHLVVVDNGSSPDEVSELHTAAAALDFDLIENGDNLGIAAALNLGVRRAQALGAEWVFFFDQDSRVTDGFVATMLRGFGELSTRYKLGILNPRYLDMRFGHTLHAPGASGGILEATTTSGSLMPVSLFAEAGYFAEELFIDGVDYEYSLRVRRLGYTLAEYTEAVLLHSPGTPTYHRLLWWKRFQAGNYSPIRRYYQERNKILVAKQYWRDYRPFLLGQFSISAEDLVKIVLVEQNKVEKVTYFFRGILDGLRGRTGKLEPRG